MLPETESDQPSEPHLSAPVTDAQTTPVIDKWLLRAAVIIGGAAVMIIEILGSRILAPVFGTTLHVWSALITVTLAALAIGYAWGGRLADRYPGLKTLMIVMTAAAGMLLLSDLMTAPVLRITYRTGLVDGTFIAATILFLPTLLLLGMVSPMAVRVAVDRQQPGTSVGNLYAISTIGSVAGSLGVSLILIPNFRVHTAIIATAVALALVPLFYLLTIRQRIAAMQLILIVTAVVTLTTWAGRRGDSTILYRNETHSVTARLPSSYGDLVVTDHNGVRYLFLNGVQQGSLKGNFSAGLYTWGLQRIVTAKGLPKTILCWGLGPGLFARAMTEAGAQVTVIEIDPMSEKVAREYFGLPASVNVIIGDARTETRRLQDKYDAIVLDAFNGDTVPSHLLTREAFESLRERLAPGGVVALNIIGGTGGSAARAVSSVVMTMEEVFGKTQVLMPSRLMNGMMNRNYVSTMFPVAGELPDTPLPFTLPFPTERKEYIDAVFAARITLPRDQAIVLTDAYAPLEAWSDAAVETMR